jgi:hypothetical protein
MTDTDPGAGNNAARTPGCTCERPYESGGRTNRDLPPDRQYHDPCCDLTPNFTGWLYYKGDDETGAYVNPRNLKQAYVMVNPDGIGDYFYLVRAKVVKIR